MSSLDNLAYLGTLAALQINSLSVQIKINNVDQPTWLEIYIALRIKNALPTWIPIIYNAEKADAITDLEAKIAAESATLAADQALLAQLQGG